MSIAVTGGAGFIGSHLCEKLINLGFRVICIDNFDDFYNPALKEDNISGIIDNPGFKLYRSDICDPAGMEEIFSNNDIEMVIHLAARAGVRPSIADPLLYGKVNVSGTVNILECCRRYGIKKFIFASSSSVYGGNKKIPFSEKDNVFGISIFCFRFFTVYGPRQRPEMAIHKFSSRVLNGRQLEIYGDGSSSRDYTYIDDIISGLVSSIGSIKGYEVINLGNSKTVKLIELVRLIEEMAGNKADLKFMESQPGDVFITYADIRKARKMLKYSPGTNIREGLAGFIKWYKEKKEEGLFDG